jgi:hypothetical protein
MRGHSSGRSPCGIRRCRPAPNTSRPDHGGDSNTFRVVKPSSGIPYQGRPLFHASLSQVIQPIDGFLAIVICQLMVVAKPITGECQHYLLKWTPLRISL